MGAEAGWEPIKVYESLYGLDQNNLSREQIKQKLDAAKPDEVHRAGQAFIDAADLVGGKVGGNGPSEMGIQAALSRTAKDLAEVWRGPAAEQVQSALRALYATAGALGDAMTASGAAMSWYADVVRDARTNFPAAPSGSDEGAGGGTTGSPPPDPDEAARNHFRALNEKIQEANNAFAEGLAFDLPAIEPLHIDLASSPRIHVGGTGAPVTSTDGVWHGGSYGNGTSGSGTGGSGSAGSGSGSGGSGSGGGGHSGGGSGGADGTGSGNGDGTGGSGSAGDPGRAGSSQDPGGSADPGQAGTGQNAGQNTGGNTGQPGGSGDGSGTAPAVIGGGSDRTDLANAHLLPGGTTPAGTTPNGLTGYPDARIPVTTSGPTNALPPGGVIGVYGGARTGYGAGVTGEAGAVLGGYRTGQSGAGSPLFPYAPGGADAGGQDEREREIYDPEPDVWRVPSVISPDRIG
ncbi:WXG100 family type VII secretion target [Microbispora sp. CA-102843]|uniref:WXG100 family type VII secretion target n=1 Tax=Microbispora sp. CA-102843 TaxID=3239952 RepID=UPI003D9414B3